MAKYKYIDGGTVERYWDNQPLDTSTDEVVNYLREGGIIDPADPVPPPTWQEKRATRYKTESDPLYVKAMAQAQTDGIAPDFTAHAAKVIDIKTAIFRPKAF